MKKATAVISTSIVLTCACGDASRPGNAHDWSIGEIATTEPTVAYGWNRPVTAANFDPAAANKLGSASNTIAGKTLREIVTDANVRIRADNQACSTCHTWASSIERTAFCDRVDALVAQPTSKGDGTDPTNAKPEILKSLVSKWKDANCPD